MTVTFSQNGACWCVCGHVSELTGLALMSEVEQERGRIECTCVWVLLVRKERRLPISLLACWNEMKMSLRWAKAFSEFGHGAM